MSDVYNLCENPIVYAFFLYYVFVVASGHQLVAHYRFLLNASHFTDASVFIFFYDVELVCRTLPSIQSMCTDAFGRVFIFMELVDV